MKYCVKKVYCPNCLKLVNCVEEMREKRIHAICQSCQSSIRYRDEARWRVSSSAEALEKVAHAKKKKAKKAKEQKSEEIVTAKTK